MFGFVKTSPTTFVMLFRNGKVIREGSGLSFWYYKPTATLVQVPLSSVDVPFVFNEMSKDFQTVTLQGQLTYRVADARKLSSLMDYSVNSQGRHVSTDPEKLNDRLVAAAQVLTSAITHQMTLKDVLVAQEQLSTEVLAGLRASEGVIMLGLEVLALSIMAIRPAPDVAKALEAQTREELQQRSDEAIYARRNASVEQERRIKESELNTEIAIEEKKRLKRETQMAADIAIEEQRKGLIESKVENDRKQADAQAYGIEAMLRAVKDVDYRILLALNSAKMDPRQSIALAFRELAENAGKIGELNITPDLLQSLMSDSISSQASGSLAGKR